MQEPPPIAAFVMAYPWPFLAIAGIVVGLYIAYLVRTLRG